MLVAAFHAAEREKRKDVCTAFSHVYGTYARVVESQPILVEKC